MTGTGVHTHTHTPTHTPTHTHTHTHTHDMYDTHILHHQVIHMYNTRTPLQCSFTRRNVRRQGNKGGRQGEREREKGREGREGGRKGEGGREGGREGREGGKEGGRDYMDFELAADWFALRMQKDRAEVELQPHPYNAGEGGGRGRKTPCTLLVQSNHTLKQYLDRFFPTVVFSSCSLTSELLIMK